MDGGQQSKQQIIDRLKSTTNILITVSTNPSVDELSAALSLTLLLNKMKKQATAVFSGAIPPAIQFLEPEKTFEGTVDSLRDFIVALDKQKAGRIKYKVDGNMVRIFITPYRTVITQKDLEFSQGDFNVETIVALGVERREEIDKAITAHGRILHDATVVTISAKNESNNLGSIDWQEGKVSSLCEMLMSMTDDLGPDLLDAQIATALLTGIVSATGRFSNQKTSPRAMTMAAQLMAAGANQQLIATKLQDRLKPLATPPNVKPVDAAQDDASEDGTVVLNPRAETPAKTKDTTSNGKNSAKTESKAAAQPSAGNEPATDNDEPEEAPAPAPQKKKAVGEIEISHQDEPAKPAQPSAQAPKAQAAPTESSQTPVGTLPDAFKAVAAAPKTPVAPVESTEDYALSPDQYAERRQKAAIAEAEEELASALPQAAPSSQMPSFEDLQSEIKAMEQAQDAPEPAPIVEAPAPAPVQQQAEPVSAPSMPPPPAQPQFSPLPTPIAPAEPKQSPKADAGAPALSPAEPRESASQPSWMEREITEPTLGGSLSATTQQAAEDKLAEEGDAERRNHTILSHRGDGGHNSRPVSPITLPEPNPVAPSEPALFSPLPAATAPVAPAADIAPAPQPVAEPVQFTQMPPAPDPSTMLPTVPGMAESFTQPQAFDAPQPQLQPAEMPAAMPMSTFDPLTSPVSNQNPDPNPLDAGNLDAARQAVEAALSSPSLATSYEATPLPPAPEVPSLAPLDAALNTTAAPMYDANGPAMPPIPNAPAAMPPLPPSFSSPLPIAPDQSTQPLPVADPYGPLDMSTTPTNPVTPYAAPPVQTPQAPPSPGQYRIPGQ